MDRGIGSSGVTVGGRSYLRAGVIALLALAASYFFATYFGLFGAPAAPAASEWQRKYWEAISKADSASYVEDWAEVAKQYAKINTLQPYSPASRYNRATALAHLGRPAESFTELGLAITYGWVDLTNLKSDPIFGDVRKASGFEKLLHQAEAVAKESIVVYVPPGHDSDQPLPLVITFHGLGENPHSHIQSWKHTADEIGAVVVAPRGNQSTGGSGNAHAFRWAIVEESEGGDRLQPFKEIVEQSIELAKEHATIDESRILLAGYSQGGSVAIALLTDAPARFCGAVLQAPSYRSGSLQKWTTSPRFDSLRVCVLVHEFDKMRPQGDGVYRELKNAGATAQLLAVTGSDHEIPLDNESRQVHGVRFVLGAEAVVP